MPHGPQLERFYTVPFNINCKVVDCFQIEVSFIFFAYFFSAATDEIDHLTTRLALMQLITPLRAGNGNEPLVIDIASPTIFRQEMPLFPAQDHLVQVVA